jgi:hypothetical protein
MPLPDLSEGSICRPWSLTTVNTYNCDTAPAVHNSQQEKEPNTLEFMTAVLSTHTTVVSLTNVTDAWTRMNPSPLSSFWNYTLALMSRARSNSSQVGPPTPQFYVHGAPCCILAAPLTPSLISPAVCWQAQHSPQL